MESTLRFNYTALLGSQHSSLLINRTIRDISSGQCLDFQRINSLIGHLAIINVLPPLFQLKILYLEARLQAGWDR